MWLQDLACVPLLSLIFVHQCDFGSFLFPCFKLRICLQITMSSFDDELEAKSYVMLSLVPLPFVVYRIRCPLHSVYRSVSLRNEKFELRGNETRYQSHYWTTRGLSLVFITASPGHTTFWLAFRQVAMIAITGSTLFLFCRWTTHRLLCLWKVSLVAVS